MSESLLSDQAQPLTDQIARIPSLLAIHEFRLPADQPPWVDTEVDLLSGQWITILGSGRVSWSSREQELWAGPKHHLWGKVGRAGKIFNPTQDTTTIPVLGSGRLFLGLLHGFWANERGVLASDEKAYKGLSGEIVATVLVWDSEPGEDLVTLRDSTSLDAIAAEAKRYKAPVRTPQGWSYLFETGFGDIFRDVSTEYGPGIEVKVDNAQGIVRKPVRFPLTESTELCWRWRLDQFPSSVSENTVRTHDYFSIACEFENGRDLTWFWSCDIPSETHFGCPVRDWNFREVHYCVRSGDQQLGTWIEERRNVFDDCRAALAEDPGGVNHIWLIAVSSFQHGKGLCTFADVWLRDGERSIKVL